MTKWRKITDKAPKPGMQVLVCGGTWESDLSSGHVNDNTCLVTVPEAGTEWQETGGEYYGSWINTPTHWQPCPEPHQD